MGLTPDQASRFPTPHLNLHPYPYDVEIPIFLLLNKYKSTLEYVNLFWFLLEEVAMY